MGIEANLSTPLAEAVRNAGGQSSFARLINRNQSTIYDWLRKNTKLPAELAALVERSTGVPRSRLRPDVFDAEHSTDLTVDASTFASDNTGISDGRAA